MLKPDRASTFSLYFIYITSLFFVANVWERHESQGILIGYFVFFSAYFLLAKYSSIRTTELFILGIVSRLVLFVSIPNLSDDFYRFIWDGMLVTQGINPYNLIPTEVSHLNPDLFSKLNSQIFPTTYTPFNQLFFTISYFIGQKNDLLAVNVIRSFLLISDIVAYYLLRRILVALKKSPNLVFWYFLNPLVVLELVGNLHFEGMMIAFLLGSIFYLVQNKKLLAGVFLGIAIAIKLIPLIFLPFLLFRYRWKKGIVIISMALLVTAISFLPFLQLSFIEGMKSGLLLYFQKFEFNASLYYLVREIGYHLKGYNIIQSAGPILGFLTMAIIIYWSITSGAWEIESAKAWIIVLAIYLSLSTTVHPWYSITLIPLGIITGMFWPIIWSLLIFITYIGYTQSGYEHNMSLIMLEYGLLCLWCILEFIVYKQKYIFASDR